MGKQTMMIRDRSTVRWGRITVYVALLAALFTWLLMPGRFDADRVLAEQTESVAQLGGVLYYVNTTSDTVIIGACQNGSAGCSLRGAISAANTNPNADGIEFSIPASEQFCSGSVCTIFLLSALPDISTNLNIAGPGSDKLTVAKGAGGSFRIFNVTATSTVAISGLTVSNGSLATPVDGAGAGISNGSGTLTITGCSIANNRTAGSGGGISNNGTLNIINSTIFANAAEGTIGVGVGGGIANAGTMTVTNSTVYLNSARDGAGGIMNYFGRTVNVTNSTITRNSAGNATTGGGGGGIENAMGGSANVKSTIIALNTVVGFGSQPDVKGAFGSAGFNFIGERNGSTGFTTPTDLTGDPRLEVGMRSNGGPTQTVALRKGSPAIDKGTSIGLTGNLSTDQRGTGFPRTIDNPAIANAAGGDGTDIGAFELRTKSPVDFDGDGKTDVSIFRPAPGQWWIQTSSNSNVMALQFGASTDRITPGDLTGDGKTDIAFWRPSNGFWFVLRSEDFSFYSFPFGTNGDIPTVGDFDGDRKDDVAVFRPSDTNWYISRAVGPTTIRQFGVSGDVPVAADYDGDGIFDIAIYRPSVGQWWINRSSTLTTFALQFGSSTDKPTQGDFTGDGNADIAFWRPSTGSWFVLRSEDSSFYAFPFGANGDIPTPGDYDGDGKLDPAIFRPSNATWYLGRSSAGVSIQQFGISVDKPVPSAFVP